LAHRIRRRLPARSVRPWTPTEGDVGDALVITTSAALLHRWLPLDHLALGAHHLSEHRRKEKEIDEVGIELRAASFQQHLTREIARLRVAIAPAVSEGVEGIDDGHDACGEGDSPALEPARVPLSIPSFMV